MFELSSGFILGYILLVCRPDQATCTSNTYEPDPVVCIAEEPCTCTLHELTCTNADLTSVPEFSVLEDVTYNFHVYFVVDLSYNSITEIDNEAFLNFSTVSTYMDTIDVNLRDNSISYVDVDAFAGLGYNVTALDLRNNNLSYIPAAIETLHSLGTLRLSGNPLRSISSTAVYYAARTVTYLSISMSLFNEWPKELQYYEALEFLTVDHYPFSDLPLNAFQGFEDSLLQVILDATSLHRLPSAICNLQSLRWLYYTHNYNTELPLFEHCDNNNFTTLTELDLSDNGLDLFPDILSSFPSLKELHLGSNNIGAVDGSLLPFGHLLTKIYLDRNDLQTIPSEVFQLKRLDHLDVSYNQIHAINVADLDDAPDLAWLLDLSGNPLDRIADDAFNNKTLTSIIYLKLASTHLTSIPRALMSIHIHQLHLQGCPVDCSCKMSYLKDWYHESSQGNNRIAHLVVYGTCANTGQDFKEFLDEDLPLCPDDLTTSSDIDILGK